MDPRTIEINGRAIGPGQPAYIIAELSANHNQDYENAVSLIRAAKDAGADAVKLQTYTADTITLNCDSDLFRIKGTIWDGRNLHDLYGEAHTPWDWQPQLKAVADKLDITLFSSPFDHTAVDFLEDMGSPAYKVASFEIVDIPLLKRIAQTRKPVIVSTGMATLSEIDEAVNVLREEGVNEVVLLKCTSSYPAPYEEMNLRTITHLAEAFDLAAGLSDHTLGIAVPVAAVALGACVVEKHFTLSRETYGPDSAFSLEPHEFKLMVDSIRNVEASLGVVHYGLTEEQSKSRVYRRSLFVVRDMKAGDTFTSDNVRSIRPAYGLHTRYLEKVVGRQALRDITMGTPLSWELIKEGT